MALMQHMRNVAHMQDRSPPRDCIVSFVAALKVTTNWTTKPKLNLKYSVHASDANWDDIGFCGRVGSFGTRICAKQIKHTHTHTHTHTQTKKKNTHTHTPTRARSISEKQEPSVHVHRHASVGNNTACKPNHDLMKVAAL